MADEPTQYRQVEAVMEVREEGDGRTIVGVFVPYNVDQPISPSLTERFVPGAFTHQFKAANRIRLWAGHSVAPNSMMLGRVTELHDETDGLHGEMRVVDRSPVADHWLALAREGVSSHLSIGFDPVKQFRDGNVVVRTRADLTEIAMVPEGAYHERARVLSVRSVALATPNIDRWRKAYPYEARAL